jgi:hypothetical protein
MVPPRRILLGLAGLVAALAGCSDPYAGRMEVNGAVTLQGEPLSHATINFIPLDKQDTRSSAAVENGQYHIPRESGLKAGKYLIQITAGDGKTPANEEAGGPGGSTNIISVDQVPDDWNVKSTHEITVNSTGPNKHDFTIPNRNPRAKRR